MQRTPSADLGWYGKAVVSRELSEWPLSSRNFHALSKDRLRRYV
jgi:hypothetical protein